MKKNLFIKGVIVRVKAVAIFSALVLGITPQTTLAATPDAMFELHPHCIQREGETDDWVFGPIPSPGIVVETREASTRCTTFEIRDPQTLQTPALRKGDILDIDVLIDNPSGQNIRRARAWLSYDPNMLEGISVEIEEKFPIVTPDEQGFSESEGYVKMEASTAESGPNDKQLLFARIQMRVKKTNSIGTPITFHDAQPAGHSVIMAAEAEDEVYIQKEEPGVLLVTFVQDANSPPTEAAPAPGNDNEDNIFDNAPSTLTPEPVPADDNSCLRDEDCDNQVCVAGQCQKRPTKKINGDSCTFDSECQSGICSSGTCVPELENTTSTTEQDNNRTAFSLLQIRNVRATTDGSSIFLAWDHLQSSQLKAYNVYYGTTSGRYIQRRTIDKSENSITLRSLTLGQQYFLAVRGLSTQDEESAFSQEVSIVVGDPSSSTAPLVQNSVTRGPETNPVGNLTGNGNDDAYVPGETGASSIALLFLLASAVIGTTFASRRQIVVSNKHPNNA